MGDCSPARELIPPRWKQLPPLPTEKPARSPAQLACTGLTNGPERVFMEACKGRRIELPVAVET
ncbi:MAG: hypothetical protein AMXMBFR7_51550 [Planctomycetota bacterium]